MDSLSQMGAARRPQPHPQARPVAQTPPQGTERGFAPERGLTAPPPVETSLLPRATQGYADSRKVFDITR